MTSIYIDTELVIGQEERQGKRALENKLNILIENAVLERIRLIENDLDYERYMDDIFIVMTHNYGIKWNKKGNSSKEEGTNLQIISLITEKEVLKMESQRKLLEAKLRLAAQAGKNSASYKHLEEIGDLEPTEDRRKVLQALSKLDPPLSEEIIIQRGE